MSVAIAYQVTEAARLAGVSADTIRRAIRSVDGKGDLPHLPARKVGARHLILHDDLVAWVNSLPEG